MFNQFVLGLLAGYLIWTLFSHPKSPIPKLCPKINFGKRIQILPRLKIFYKEHKAFVFHHWLWAIPILIFFLIFFNGLVFVKGFLVGSIGQGLRYQDRSQLREVVKN